MKAAQLKIRLSEKLGSISAIEMMPGDPAAFLVLAHGAGAGMSHPFLQSLCTELHGFGIGTFRFNFHYMENRKGRPDPPVIACLAVEKALNKAAERNPDIPLFAGGKSFGGRMTSTWMAQSQAGRVRGLVFFGFPLHAPGKPSVERGAHLKQVTVPMLFLQGTKDEFAARDLLHQVVGGHPKATLREFEGADHSFKVSKRNLIPDLALAAAEWIRAEAEKKR